MTTEATPVFLGLREQFLETRRDDLVGLNPTDPVYAAMIESVANGIVVSTAVSGVGDASFYSSNGGGGLGGIKVPAIRQLAKDCLAAARAMIDRTEPIVGVPSLPASNEFSLILLTDEGLRQLRLKTDAKVGPNDPLIQLSRAAGAVVQALLDARRQSD